VIGVVAMVAGAFAVATGPEGQLGGEAVNANVESEYRFYAALWIAYGAVALRLAPRAEREPAILNWLMAILFGAGVARAVAWAAAGRPDDLYLALLALELVIPPVLLLVNRAPARGSPTTPRRSRS
jgi:hypothetical protein